MFGGPDDHGGGHFRLVERRDGLGLVREFVLDPRELRGIKAQEMYHDNVAIVLNGFREQRLREPLDRVLGAKVADWKGLPDRPAPI